MQKEVENLSIKYQIECEFRIDGILAIFRDFLSFCLFVFLMAERPLNYGYIRMLCLHTN